ncbi:MAG: TonB-dependent receptor [Candidatus Omnitrophica bacterium]|nr:TonB-dependent receptor [Candidatus Omnitrophota bacterium]
MKKLLVLLFGATACFNAIAEESTEVELPPIVVSPTRYESTLSSIPSSITVISEEQIELEAKPMVKDVLKYVPGVDIAETSTFGGTASIYTRGTNSNHTLVMIDGVKIYNPMSVNGAFDPANLTLDNIERIEILRGTHSTLYGSDAIGGVIDIITKKGSGKPKIWASFEGGSYVTLKEAVGSDGEMNGLYYSATVSRIDTRGISKADGKFNNGERDAYHNTSVSSRVDYDVFDNLTIGSTFRYTDTETKLDDSGGYGGDDPNRRNREINTIASAYADCAVFEWWKLGFKSSWLEYRLYDKDKGDDFDPGEYLNSKFVGKNTFYGGTSILDLFKGDVLLAGIDYNEQEGDSFSDSFDAAWGQWLTDSPRVKNHNVGYFIQNKFDAEDKFHSIAGFRIDDDSEFGTYDTYEISGKYTFDWKTSVKGKWATGFKAPSLYQLYDPTNGNPNLKPEQSESFEAGLGQEFFDGCLKVESTYFHTKLDNLIDWTLVDPIWFTGQYRNVQKARIDGIENLLIIEPIKEIKINYAYTYLNARNEGTKQSLNRRPRNKHSVSIDIFPLDNLSFNVSYLFVADRKDIRWVGGTEEQIVLKHYNKVDLSGRYVINKYAEIFGRVENLLNQNYEEADGYGMPGIAFYGGCKTTF